LILIGRKKKPVCDGDGKRSAGDPALRFRQAGTAFGCTKKRAAKRRPPEKNVDRIGR
jgi:hypothetical protein